VNEPTHISDIMPGVLGDIRQRMNDAAAEHRERVFGAVVDFEQERKRRANGRPAQKTFNSELKGV